jgi:glycosyltransferase involved in cell wall biosynthesis
MRIGIDARELCGRATGAGRYLHGLLRQWAADDSARRHEFVLYAPEPLGVTFDARRFATRLVKGVPNTWWEQVRLPPIAARDHLDVFFSPAYTSPLTTRIPTVTAIHDVSFAAHPEWFSAREGLRRRTISRRAAKQARAIVTISEFSRREIVEHLGVAESRVHVIPPGVAPPGAPDRQVARRPLVLYVGSIFNRRRLPDLIRAFAPVACAHPDAALEIVGDDRTLPAEDLDGTIARSGLVGRAVWRRFVSDDELGRLYWSARAFAFLSEYEGLGLTPLEALAADVPPVLLDTPVARESCGGAGLYTASGDVAGVTAALERLLYDEGVRKRLLEAAPAVLSRYTWPRAARETLALLERSAAESRA